MCTYAFALLKGLVWWCLFLLGCTALQAYPWTGDMYSHSVQVPHTVLKPQFSSHGSESHYPSLVPPQSYITSQGPSCPSLAKPATPDPLLASVKTELEETGYSQPAKVSESETIFHCDFSPLHFWQVCANVGVCELKGGKYFKGAIMVLNYWRVFFFPLPSTIIALTTTKHTMSDAFFHN